MFKTLALATTLGSALLNGCPPPDQTPAPEPCVQYVTTIREPRREALQGMNPDCIINVYLDNAVIEGRYPWRRCVSYWQGHYFVVDGIMMCIDIEL